MAMYYIFICLGTFYNSDLIKWMIGKMVDYWL